MEELEHAWDRKARPRRGRAVVWIALAVGAAALGGWAFFKGGVEGETSAATDGAGDVEPAATEPALMLLENRVGVPEWLRPRLEQVDSEHDEAWESELRSLRVAAQLQRLAQAMALELEMKTALEAVAEPGARCNVAARREGQRLGDADAPLQVERDLFETAPAASELGAGLALLLDDFTRGAAVRAEFELFRIGDTEPDGGFETEVRFLAYGPARQGGRLQLNAHWRCGWRADDETAPRITELEVSEVEAVHATSETPLLADCTGTVLARAPETGRSLLVGLGVWNAILDRQLGSTLFGHHGLCVGDFDGDGLEDVYVCQPAGLPNLLLLQEPDGTVRDAAAAAGVDFLDTCPSALAVDLDNDGDQDLAVAVDSGISLLENDGECRFTRRGHIETGYLYSIAAGDADGDGDLDLYGCRYKLAVGANPTPYHDANNGEPNVFARCVEPFQYEDATAAVGLDEHNTRYSFAATWVDYDDDGDADLYVANDFGRNSLYRNDEGRFSDVAAEAGVEDISAGMSVSWGDGDGDGLLDLYVGNMYSSSGCRITYQRRFRSQVDDGQLSHYQRHARGNTLFANHGDGTFEDVSLEAAVTMGRWAWSSLFVDVDNDGLEDLAVANGFITNDDAEDLGGFFWRRVVACSPSEPGVRDPEYDEGWTLLYELVRQGRSFAGNERNIFFLNTGTTRFADASAITGFDFKEDSRAIGLCDWDQDGALDMWVSARTSPRARLLRNTGGAASGRHWVVLRLEGVRSNRDAIGARVELELADGRRLVRALMAGDGFLSQSSKELHFGLGPTAAVGRVWVRWPGGEREDFGPLARVDQRYHLREGAGRAEPWSPSPAAAAGLASRGAFAPEALGPPARIDRGRTDLAGPLPIAGLSYLDEGGAMRPLAPDGRWLLAQLWSRESAECTSGLRELALEARSLRAAGVDVLALCVDEEGGEARRVLSELGWPHGSGFASPQLIDAFAVVLEVVHEQPPSMAVPTGFLLDPRGNLRAVFRGEVAPAELREAVALHTGSRTPSEMRELASPFEGRWIGRPRGPRLLTIANRFSDRGHLDTAASYLTRIEVSPELRSSGEGARLLSSAHTRLGYRLAERGDVAAAITLFQRSLEIDPDQPELRRQLEAAQASTAAGT